LIYLDTKKALIFIRANSIELLCLNLKIYNFGAENRSRSYLEVQVRNKL